MKRLAEDAPTLVGMDHGFSFPLRYFEVHWLKPTLMPHERAVAQVERVGYWTCQA